MAKEGSWDCGFIDDNQNKISKARGNVFGEDEICSQNDVLMQCVSVNYNVTKDKILKFHWLGIEWNYAQLILDKDGWVQGVRLVICSPYLNPFYMVQSCIKNEELLNKHFYCWEIHSNCKILEKYNFDVRYEEIGNEYKITTDIISCWYNLNEKADKLYAAKRSNKI